MLGDIISAILLFLIFIVEIILGFIIINSASGLTPALRKTDANLARAYDQFILAGQLSLYTGIIGALIALGALLFVGLKPDLFDGIPRYGKIIIKSIFGVAVIIITVLISYYLYEASNNILSSHTYKISRFQARQEFDSSVFYAQMTAGFYILLAVILMIIFVSMGIYDSLKDRKRKVLIIDDEIDDEVFVRS
jgi:hypothetical protein